MKINRSALSISYLYQKLLLTHPVEVKMFVIPLLIFSFSLNFPSIVTAGYSYSTCNSFEKYILRKSCNKKYLVPQSEVENRGGVASCNYFEKYILRKSECFDSDENGKEDGQYYSKCNSLEKRLLSKEFCKYNPDEVLDVPQIIARHGYLSETHTVVTEDGYILKIHRIPKKKNGPRSRQPVLLQHGILGSSADWIINGNNSLAYLLADQGYDVWLGNARGNDYSRGHVSLPINTAQYWNFSFHEMGTKDLPTVLYYISNTTNSFGDIIYIGHSMGTTIFFAFASENPEAAKNVKMMAGMGAVAYLTHMKSPIRYLAPFSHDLEWLEKYLGFHQFLPNNKILRLLSYQCELFNIDATICENVIFSICGFNKEEFNTAILPVLLSKDPAGASTKSIVHYAQEVRNGGAFQQFDYGTKGNLIKYGTKFPPKYNLSNINPPVFLIYGMNDWLANYTDVIRLGRELKNLVGLYKVPMDSFNHVDYIFGKDAEKLVYRPLMKVLKKYSTF
ncbi:unnamed protein product [Psylliodes chrysocephalus]|uniref:Partial AB-hydrolase lipase domain-containing protein n=1 Tax=Psylliodes chrysocephalus TaxID=3402493 RepID=A0A9P0CQ63_9CUCU|nr:unnamed protein product [Psylliodes chrysocephala]